MKKTKEMLNSKMQVKLPETLSTENIMANIENKYGSTSQISNGVYVVKDGEAFAYGLNGETFIIASYDHDGMIACKTYPALSGDVKIKIAEAIDTDGATKVKAFLWKDLETCMPLCNHAEE